MNPGQNQYDFITNPAQPPKKSLLPGKLNLSKKMLILLGSSVLLILIMIIVIAVSMLNSAPSNKVQLLTVAQQQNELIRVSDIALKEAKSVQARNLAMTTKLSLRSDQTSLVSSLNAQNIKVDSKQLQAGKNADTDKKLTEASQNNRFDDVYLDYIQKELVEYQKSLESVYKSTTSKKLKETLRVQYRNASLIIGVEPEA